MSELSVRLQHAVKTDGAALWRLLTRRERCPHLDEPALFSVRKSPRTWRYLPTRLLGRCFIFTVAGKKRGWFHCYAREARAFGFTRAAPNRRQGVAHAVPSVTEFVSRSAPLRHAMRGSAAIGQIRANTAPGCAPICPAAGISAATRSGLPVELLHLQAGVLIGNVAVPEGLFEFFGPAP